MTLAIPPFPDFAPLSLDIKEEMRAWFSETPDGVSEFTFPALYIFRERYQYRVSKLEGKTLILSGIQPAAHAAHTAAAGGEPHIAAHTSAPALTGAEAAAAPDTDTAKKFFITPSAAPGRGVLAELFKTHDYWKLIPESVLIPERERLEAWGVEFAEDRDNFDYLYPRSDLAELPGKKYHKKRNLVAQFLKTYAHEEKPLTAELVPAALEILETWRAEKGNAADYAASREALEHFEEFNMRGLLFYVDGKPAGWCMGEPVARDSIFTVHFEKGLDGYKGIYQFINQAFAAFLGENFIYINREQDLGDEGLRQAKMTYRPSGFVRKYSGFYRAGKSGARADGGTRGGGSGGAAGETIRDERGADSGGTHARADGE